LAEAGHDKGLVSKMIGGE